MRGFDGMGEDGYEFDATGATWFLGIVFLLAAGCCALIIFDPRSGTTLRAVYWVLGIALAIAGVVVLIHRKKLIAACGGEAQESDEIQRGGVK